MANRARGETELTVEGIGTVKLCFTMAAMAEIEDSFKVGNMQEALAKIGENPGSAQIAKVIKALLIGTEHEGFTVDQIRRWPVSPLVIKDALDAMNGAEGNAEASPAAHRKPKKAKVGK